MFCKECGKELKDTQKFCPQCGTENKSAIKEDIILPAELNQQENENIDVHVDSEKQDNIQIESSVVETQEIYIPNENIVDERRNTSHGQKKIYIILGVVVVALVIVAVTLTLRLNKSKNTAKKATQISTQTTIASTFTTTQQITQQTTQKTTTIQTTVVPSTSSLEALVLQGNVRYYTDAELASCSAYELSILRNGLYALSGKKFTQNPNVISFFENCSWYKPDTTDDGVVKSRWNKYQTANLASILRHES